MAEKIRELLREYQQGKLSRREFMRQAIIATGSLAAANSLIASLLPSTAVAAQVPPNDPGHPHAQCPVRRQSRADLCLSRSSGKSRQISCSHCGSRKCRTQRSHSRCRPSFRERRLCSFGPRLPVAPGRHAQGQPKGRRIVEHS